MLINLYQEHTVLDARLPVRNEMEAGCSMYYDHFFSIAKKRNGLQCILFYSAEIEELRPETEDGRPKVKLND